MIWAVYTVLLLALILVLNRERFRAEGAGRSMMMIGAWVAVILVAAALLRLLGLA